MAGDQHDQTVSYADMVAPLASVNVDVWECWSLHQGDIVHYYAKGPCPGCGAASQGHLADATAPVESLGRPKPPPPPGPPAPSEPVEIPLRCTCGSTHGHDDAKGCGRRWSIICRREQP